jgi:hypothetical protein
MSGRLAMAAVSWVCAAALARGHGIVAEQVEGGVGVRAVYDDGAPVAFGEVRVFAPGDQDKPVLEGATYRGGCFLFRPDTGGTWRIVIDDGMGHAVSRDLPVGTATAVPARGAERMPKFWAAITGLALLFGASGWLSYLRARKAGKP